MKWMVIAALIAATGLWSQHASAEAISVEGVLEPQEQIKFQFGDGGSHFVLAVRRTGTFAGTGAFDGAQVTEIGWHDVEPPMRGEPIGYLQVTASNGDIAVLRWQVRAAFIAGPDGKPQLFDNGVWTLVRGTGAFADQHGVGSVVLKPMGGPTKFILDGEIGDAPAG